MITAVSVSQPSHPIARFYPSTGKASAAWGRCGIVGIPTGVVAQTADGAYDPASGRFGNTILGLTKELRLNDSYRLANWDYLNRKDFDLGVSSPTVFKFDRWTLVATAAKEGIINLLDAKNLGGDNHMTPLYVSPRFGNDAPLFGYNGVWGSLSTWVDSKGERWLLVPMMGPPAKDTAAMFGMSDGGWGWAAPRSYLGGRDVTHAVLYALDAETGNEIYSSKETIDSWNHYGGIALAGGRIYLTTYDARVFAFGMPPRK